MTLKINMQKLVMLLLTLMACKAEAKISMYISQTPPDLNSSTIETTLNRTSVFSCLQTCMRDNCFHIKYDDISKY